MTSTIPKKSKMNGGGATGADTVSHLQAIEELLSRPLRALVTECDLCAGLLLEHFRSPLAHKGHVKAVVTAMKLGALPENPESLRKGGFNIIVHMHQFNDLRGA